MATRGDRNSAVMRRGYVRATSVHVSRHRASSAFSGPGLENRQSYPYKKIPLVDSYANALRRHDRKAFREYTAYAVVYARRDNRLACRTS